MIRTAEQYEEVKEFIGTNPEFYDYTLSEKMNSYEYNLYLQDTQYYFNVLYEKLRELEDMIEYLDWYSKKKISAVKDIINKKEADINNLTVTNNKPKYTIVRIEPDNSSSIILDRDGSVLNKALITDSNTITSSFIEVDRKKILGVAKKTNQLCDSDNIDSFTKDGYYLSSYSLDEPKIIEEILEIELDNNQFNRVNYEPINCKIEYLGKNDSNKIELKLTTGIMRKSIKAFNSKPYNGSNLETLEKMNFAAKSSSISDNVTELNSSIDEYNKRKYLSAAQIYQDLIAENERKDSFNIETNNKS